MSTVKSGESYICPVCGKYTFESAGEFEICPVCNCANHMSLNQAREAWKNGQKVE